MTDITIADDKQELKVEKLDDYLVAAASIVAELRDFLASHHAELVKCHIKIHGKGATMDMPAAHLDPQYAGYIHNLKNACDQFCNTMRGVY